jgi:hypothetical protein
MLLLAVGGCAGTQVSGASQPCVLLAFDDGQPQGTIDFPTLAHESVVRFELPPGGHKLRRLWVQAAGAGTLHWFLYDQTPLEGPGTVLSEGTLVVSGEQVSNGRDGRWVTEDLSALPEREGVIWLGLRKSDGAPALAASRANGGQYFVRSHDPAAPLNLMPVRRTPLVRLEIAP